MLENAKSEVIGNLSKQVVRDCLINVRQHEVCLKTLLHDIINCAKNVENLEAQLAAHLDQLKNTVQSKTAIPTAQVYVKLTAFFIALAIKSEKYFYILNIFHSVFFGFSVLYVLNDLKKKLI